MVSRVWLLFLILSTTTFSQGQRRPMDPDHPGFPLAEQRVNPMGSVSPAQPGVGGGFSSATVAPGKISVAELRLPPKALHELEKSLKAYESGDLAASATHLEKVLVIDPAYSPAHNALGRLYVGLRQFDRALREFQKAAAAEPRSAEVMHNLSATLFLMKNYADAESSARATLEIDPLHNATKYVLGCALVAEERYTAEAEEMLRQGGKQVPNARLVLAKVLVRRGATEEAKTELKAYLETPNASGKDEVQCWLAKLGDEGQNASCHLK
jgi:type IV pilus assembly protein PilF